MLTMWSTLEPELALWCPPSSCSWKPTQLVSLWSVCPAAPALGLNVHRSHQVAKVSHRQKLQISRSWFCPAMRVTEAMFNKSSSCQLTFMFKDSHQRLINSNYKPWKLFTVILTYVSKAHTPNTGR